jgi:hypothetical protein
MINIFQRNELHYLFIFIILIYGVNKERLDPECKLPNLLVLISVLILMFMSLFYWVIIILLCRLVGFRCYLNFDAF